jgi:hypothetical protein
MLLTVLPYLILTALLGSAAVLLTSKTLAEKFVAAGFLPRTFVGLIPMLQSVIRVFGGILIAVGVIVICVENGWIDARLLSKYTFPACLILLGGLLLFLNHRD